MFEINITDVENFKQNQEKIIELQKKVEELSEVKMLNQAKQQGLELIKKIEKLSTYDSIQIGNIIAKLMTEFEGIPYYCKKDYYSSNRYVVRYESNNGDIWTVYPIYEFEKSKNERSFLSLMNKESLSILPPSALKYKYVSDKKASEKVAYIQCFLDFLYEKRSSKLLYKITSDELEIILQDFFDTSKELQQQRKKEIARKKEEKLQYEKKRAFEKSCLIDRKLIYKSLSYIINNYENDMSATQESKEKKRESHGGVIELYGYHNLIIKSTNRRVCFEMLVDCVESYPDEMYCYVSPNTNKDTEICFFDLKSSINPIIESGSFIEMFMDMVENLYYKNKKVSSSDIEQILITISNERKAKKRVLKIENQFL